MKNSIAELENTVIRSNFLFTIETEFLLDVPVVVSMNNV